MIFNMVGGGANSKAFAMVLVNYPQNSTLTATNVDGYKDIFDSTSANPQRLYYVSEPSGETQTCVFTITDGTQTVTKTVSGITLASAQTITLMYWNGELYIEGNEYPSVTGGWVDRGKAFNNSDYDAYNFTRGASSLIISHPSGNLIAPSISTSNMILLDNFSVAKMHVVDMSGSTPNEIGMVITDSTQYIRTNYIAKKESASPLSDATISLSFTAQGSHYVGFYALSNRGANLQLTVDRVWLE